MQIAKILNSIPRGDFWVGVTVGIGVNTFIVVTVGLGV